MYLYWSRVVARVCTYLLYSLLFSYLEYTFTYYRCCLSVSSE